MPDIFDIHTHLGGHGLDWNVDGLVELLDDYDVRRAVVMPWDDAPGQNPAANDEIAEAVRRFPDRLVGFARIHPKDRAAATKELRRAVEELGLRGLKLHPLTTGTRLDDPVTLTLVEAAAGYGVPVYFHSGDDPTTQPLMFEVLVREVPDATIVLGHAGAYLFWRDAAQLAARCSGVYLSTPGTMGPHQLAQSVRIVGAGKILFGSDTPAMHIAAELAKVEAAGLTAEERADILNGNACRLLGEEVAAR
jgi:uncharacterized protein